MQLFISDYIQVHQNISIKDQDILNQLKTVLRYRVWDVFWVQKPVYIWELEDEGAKLDRYQVRIDSWDKHNLSWNIVLQEYIDIIQDHKIVVVSMPNKREKLELICQKLTEIGIQNIIVYFTKRSIIKQPNDNKIMRIRKIIKESVEQSYGAVIPTLSFENNLTFGSEDIILYQWWEDLNIANISNFDKIKSIVIWPEWWWDDTELDIFKSSWCRLVSIWSTILRTETACIIWWWILKRS